MPIVKCIVDEKKYKACVARVKGLFATKIKGVVGVTKFLMYIYLTFIK